MAKPEAMPRTVVLCLLLNLYALSNPSVSAQDNVTGEVRGTCSGSCGELLSVAIAMPIGRDARLAICILKSFFAGALLIIYPSRSPCLYVTPLFRM